MALDVPTRAFASEKAFKTWLARSHQTPEGIWLKLAKKNGAKAGLSYDQALDAALAYGWIDGRRRSLDEAHWLIWMGPRRARSKWSRINCAKALKLIQSGAMRQAGLKEVERAKADGRWASAYEAQSKIAPPQDLIDALAKHAKARALFEALDARNRYAILYRLHDAKKAETRTRRLNQFVAMLKAGKKIYP
jgi:uncharacterized protein YdeI (YjbR/CyaY-like superfamily)